MGTFSSRSGKSISMLMLPPGMNVKRVFDARAQYDSSTPNDPSATFVEKRVWLVELFRHDSTGKYLSSVSCPSRLRRSHGTILSITSSLSLSSTFTSSSNRLASYGPLVSSLLSTPLDNDSSPIQLCLIHRWWWYSSYFLYQRCEWVSVASRWRNPFYCIQIQSMKMFKKILLDFLLISLFVDCCCLTQGNDDCIQHVYSSSLGLGHLS